MNTPYSIEIPRLFGIGVGFYYCVAAFFVGAFSTVIYPAWASFMPVLMSGFQLVVWAWSVVIVLLAVVWWFVASLGGVR